jgi:hypothetical protein
MGFKQGMKRAFKPGKYKGVKFTSGAVDVVITTPSKLLRLRK